MHANHCRGSANKRYKLGNDTEHTLIGDLQQLFEIKVPTSEPPMNQSEKLTKHLNIFTKKEIPIRFIEAKDISGKNQKTKITTSTFGQHLLLKFENKENVLCLVRFDCYF